MTQLNLTVRELAERLGGQLDGNGEAVLTGIASLESAGPGDLTFVVDARRASRLATTKAGAALVAADAPAAPLPLIRVEHVQAAVAEVLAIIGETEELPPAGTHPTAIVAGDARLDEGVAVGPCAVVGARARLERSAVVCAHAVVGADAHIGAETILLPGTVVESRCRIGRRCRVGPNAVIGSSGFGYYLAEGRQKRVPHIGTVEIGDDVDIGACSCVDRAKFGATRIGDGTKIDNLVQVAHNVQIGRGCALAGQAGIAGSAVLKDGVVLGGHAGIRDNITLGEGVQASAFAAVAQDVPAGMTVTGVPASDARKMLRVFQIWAKLPEMRDRLKKLEKRLEALEPPEDH